MFMLAVDTGGTFTDLAGYAPDEGQIRFTKSLTTYGDLIDGIQDCIHKADIPVDELEFFKHGTTLVINTLIERTGARTALVTTRGFRDVLEIGRGNRPNPFDLFYRRDPPLVQRSLRFEVTERMDGRGDPVIAPDRAEVVALAEQLSAAKVKAVGISFINAYLSPAHEERVADWLRDLLPADVFVTRATALSREWYEYERAATAAANAYVGPRVRGYLSRIEQQLKNDGFAGRIFMMGSMGGVLSLERTLVEPIQIVESGPIGGCIGAAAYAEAMGLKNVIAFDTGGTTAKCALVQNGHFAVDPVYYVGGYDRGFPIKAAVLAVVEVGAGGGSIASVDEQGRLSVGPRSAGSDPGPVAYGRGGTEPTVTDANLLLGRLDPAKFHGGELKLDVEGARQAVVKRLSAPLGYSDEDSFVRVAHGILAITQVTMAKAIRRITLERGQDPRDFVLFAYGGGGPLHAVDLAREMHIPTVLIPPEPGVFSALGMLLSDIRVQDSVTLLQPLNEAVLPGMEQAYQTMEAALRRTLESDGTAHDVVFSRSAEMRYRGQVHAVETPIADIKDVKALRRQFEEVYRARYGHADSVNPVDVVTLRAAAHSRMSRPDITRLMQLPEPGSQPAFHERNVYFAEAGHRPTKVYQRETLPAGFSGEGPALIEEYGSTTLIGPADRFTVGSLGEIRVSIGVEDRQARS
ncbi:MAG: hydantoinase/oxoprolinase family protein [Rhizobiales bacterium]|nr:hydantoinase/oxoprolinase family protein [Hyphomicrobiales bacterium]